MILSGEVSDDDSIDTGRNAVEIMWKRAKVTRIVQKTLRRLINAAHKWTLLTVAFIGMVKTKWGEIKSYTHIRHRWKNILIKLPGIISQERKAITPFETGNCPITDGILGTIVQHTNHYILIPPNFSRTSDAKLTDKIELKA
jgi:hypothetical protein